VRNFSFIALIIFFSYGPATAQNDTSPEVFRGTDKVQQRQAENNVPDYSSLISEVFAPITDQLNLTKEQQFQIIAIITETEVKMEPLMQALEEDDQSLPDVAFTELPDETKVRQLSVQEGLLMTQMIEMKIRAKANIYKVLTQDQRIQVSQQFRGRSRITGNLGALSNY